MNHRSIDHRVPLKLKRSRLVTRAKWHMIINSNHMMSTRRKLKLISSAFRVSLTQPWLQLAPSPVKSLLSKSQTRNPPPHLQQHSSPLTQNNQAKPSANSSQSLPLPTLSCPHLIPNSPLHYETKSQARLPQVNPQAQLQPANEPLNSSLQ